MIIKILLTFGLLLALVYSMAQAAPMRFLKATMGAIVATGIYFVWFPEQTNRIAEYVGVGRGADLVLYCWITVTLVVVLSLYLKTKRLDASITKLARHVAIREAKEPEERIAD